MTWLVILAVGIGSYMFRLGPLLVLQRRQLGDTGDRAIRHAGAAAVTALIALSTSHSAAGGQLIPTVITIAAAIALAVRQVSMLRLIVCGGFIYACSAIAVALLS